MIIILSLLTLPLVEAQESYTTTYITISIGVFVTMAFSVVTFILWKNQLGIGPWVLLALAALLLTASEFFRVFIRNASMHQVFLTSSLILLFITALIKYWDTVELTE